MRKSIGATLVLALLSGTAATAELSFNNLTAGCGSSCGGFGLGASAELSDRFFVSGSFSRFDSVNVYSGAIGIRTGGERYAWYGDLGVVGLSSSASFRSGSSTEPVISVGIRGMVTPDLELDAGVGSVIADGAEVGFRLTGTWFFTNRFGAYLTVVGNSNDRAVSGLGLRLNF